MKFIQPTGPKFQLLPELFEDPFAYESSSITVQDLICDLRIPPLVDNCYRKLASGRAHKHPRVFVVTRVTSYKEHSTPLSHQHAYVLLKIQPHPSKPQPSWSHLYIKVSEEHSRNPLLAQFGIYRGAAGEVTIVDSPAVHDEVIHSELSWPPEQAPLLFRVIIAVQRTSMFFMWGWFKSCHIFAAAVMDVVYDIFGGFPRTESLKSRPFIYHPFSFHMNYAARVAISARKNYRLWEAMGVVDEDGDLHEVEVAA